MAGFLQEDNGNKSCMRFMCLNSFYAAVIFGAVTLLYRPGGAAVDTQTGIIITFGFLLGAFAPKAVQKFAETKIGKS